MRLYGKLGKGDPCHDRKHCNPWRGSRTREKRNWVNDYLEAATRQVRSWPKWMQPDEVKRGR